MRVPWGKWKSDLVAERPKPARPVMNPRQCDYVQQHLERTIHAAPGRAVDGPRQAPFIGLNKPHRGDRRWVNGWGEWLVNGADC